MDGRAGMEQQRDADVAANDGRHVHVAVWGRNAGVTADASQALGQVPYTISSAGVSAPGPVPRSDSLEPDEQPCQPTAAGTTVTFSAAAGGGTAPYQTSGGCWAGRVERRAEWSSSTTLTWRQRRQARTWWR